MNPSPRRLLYLITSPLSSGFLRGQLRYLVDHGYDVVVGVGHDPDGIAARFDEGVEVVHLPFVRRPSAVADIRALVATVRLVRRVKPILVNASTPKAGLLGMLAAAICRVPVRVYVVRGLRFEAEAGRRRRFLRGLERLSFRCATNVVFNSASLRGLAEREGLVGGVPGDVIGSGSGNGVDVDRFARVPDRSEARKALGLGDDDLVVGYVGRLSRHKGIDDLVSVLPQVARIHPTVRLLLVGDVDPDDPPTKQSQATIASDPRVVHAPWQQDPTCAYAAMDLLLFASYREGLPNVPLEAQLCAVPVVGYAATGTVDAVQHGRTGVLVPVGDRDSLVAATAALLRDEGRRRELGRAARGWVATAFRQDAVWEGLRQRYDSWTGGEPQ